MKNNNVIKCFGFVSLLLLLFLVNYNYQASLESVSSRLVDLTESTCIIRNLIAQNKISDVLEDHDQSQLDLLLDNKSPAQMAFEVEVLSSTVPLVVVYYFQKSVESDRFIEFFKSVARKYEDTIKFVLVDVERLFSLAVDAQIEAVPTILLVKNREIVDQLVGVVSAELCEEKCNYYAGS